jgi:hypothetical protein
MADSVPKSRAVDLDSESEFPSNGPPIRICEEPGCGEPSVKRGRGYARWCGEHLFNHPNSPEKAGPRSKVIAPTIDKNKVKEKAEERVKALLGFAQMVTYSKGDEYCTWALGETGEPIAENIGILASNIKWIASSVEKSENIFAVAMLTLNVMKLGAMMGVHHEWIPWSGPVKMLVPKPPPKNQGIVTPIRLHNLVGKDEVTIPNADDFHDSVS